MRAIEFGQRAHLRAAHGQDHVAGPTPAAAAGPSSATLRTITLAAMLLGRDADPGVPGRVAMAERQQVAQDRLQCVDGHEHVAGRVDLAGRWRRGTSSEPMPTSRPCAVDQRGAGEVCDAAGS